MLVLVCRFLHQREARACSCEYDGGLVPQFLCEYVICAENEVYTLLVAVPVREEYDEAVGIPGLELVDERFVPLCGGEHVDVAAERNPLWVRQPVFAQACHCLFRGGFDAVKILEFLAGVPEGFLAGEPSDSGSEFLCNRAPHVGHGEVGVPEGD